MKKVFVFIAIILLNASSQAMNLINSKSPTFGLGENSPSAIAQQILQMEKWVVGQIS